MAGLTVPVGNGHYLFDGPHLSVHSLRNQSGVYIISTIVNGLHKIIDVGESHDVKNRVENHDRSPSWQNHISDTLYASALYCSEAQRMAVESLIRSAYNPPCGVH